MHLCLKSNDLLQEYANLFGTKNMVDYGSSDDNDSDEADGEDDEVFEFQTKIKVICGKCLLSMLFRTRVSISLFITHVNSAFD